MAKLLDPMDQKTGRFPFRWTDPDHTDVRATWNRLAPGWNKRRVAKPRPGAQIVPISRKA